MTNKWIKFIKFNSNHINFFSYIEYWAKYNLDNVYSRDALDIQLDNLAFFDIQYSARYQITLPDIR
jgi:hypothetical protein